MDSMLKKALASLSAGAVMALGVVSVAASPAAAVERCEHQSTRDYRTAYFTDFDFCIQADEGEVKVSIENFTCFQGGARFQKLPNPCKVTGGMVQTLKNGISSYNSPMPLGYTNDLPRHWEASLPGCEDGDFVKAFIDDLQVSYEYGDIAGNRWWHEVAYQTAFVNGGVRC
ncbi:hypothetical protein ACH4MW_23210 [Streptomyces luteogriseus]|uniref:hypothetical protein n=1 Tax=Streptomyces luteogriseus TaxID=68233 RepID=UPI003794E9E7